MARLAEKGEAVDVGDGAGRARGAQRPARGGRVEAARARRRTASTEDEFWELQTPLQREVFTSNDAKEGPKAFAEKRPPEWTGT